MEHAPKSFLTKIYEDTARLWHKLVPVSVDTFVNKVTQEPWLSRTARVEVLIQKKKECGGEPCYEVTYRAVAQEGTILLRASELFSCLECKEAHLKAEGKIPEEVEQMVWKRTYSSVMNVRKTLEKSGLDVSVQKPHSRT